MTRLTDAQCAEFYTKLERVDDIVRAAYAAGEKAERERVVAIAMARYDREVSAMEHYTGKDHPAYDWHMIRRSAMADMLDVIRALSDELTK